MSRKDKGGGGDAQDFSGMPAATVSAADIQQKEFRVSRFGGYKMRDVDEFLDHVTEAMTKLADENQRLRSATGLPSTAAVGAPDLADRSRQADEIIARARAEAAQILQDARAQAGAPGDRGAVSAYLSQEREFLQQLATLVQGHAESVKSMAKASRATPAEASATPAPVPVEAAPPPPPVLAAAAEEAPPEPEPEPEPEPAPAPEPQASERTTRTQMDTQPIRVQQPAPAAVPGGDRDDEGGEGGDASLRELFWGED